LRFLPPYIIRKRHVDTVIAALDAALKTSMLSTATPKSLGNKKAKARSNA
jgi:hypothetical protein